MNYPLIIFGAGASHDYTRESFTVADDLWRPPMTDGICNPIRFSRIIDKYPYMKDLSSGIATNVSKNKSLEEYLNYVSKVSKKNIERQKQLIAFQFYLYELFYEVSTNFQQGTNNYRALIDLIRDSTNQACIVSYNYDTLLESSLSTIIREDLNSYINNSIKVIKLHGSCDWVYTFLDRFDLAGKTKSSYDYFINAPSDFFKETNLIKANNIQFKPFTQSMVSRSKFYFPAIAIPLTHKGQHVCPERHHDTLIESLLNIDRILVIGWQARDSYLLELLNKIKQKVKVTIVSKRPEKAREIGKVFTNNNFMVKGSIHSGFSEFMRSDDSNIFFE